jgi:hypothetical protein
MIGRDWLVRLAPVECKAWGIRRKLKQKDSCARDAGEVRVKRLEPSLKNSENETIAA